MNKYIWVSMECDRAELSGLLFDGWEPYSVDGRGPNARFYLKKQNYIPNGALVDREMPETYMPGGPVEFKKRDNPL